MKLSHLEGRWRPIELSTRSNFPVKPRTTSIPDKATGADRLHCEFKGPVCTRLMMNAVSKGIFKNASRGETFVMGSSAGAPENSSNVSFSPALNLDCASFSCSINAVASAQL